MLRAHLSRWNCSDSNGLQLRVNFLRASLLFPILCKSYYCTSCSSSIHLTHQLRFEAFDIKVLLASLTLHLQLRAVPFSPRSNESAVGSPGKPLFHYKWTVRHPKCQLYGTRHLKYRGQWWIPTLPDNLRRQIYQVTPTSSLQHITAERDHSLIAQYPGRFSQSMKIQGQSSCNFCGIAGVCSKT